MNKILMGHTFDTFADKIIYMGQPHYRCSSSSSIPPPLKMHSIVYYIRKHKLYIITLVIKKINVMMPCAFSLKFFFFVMSLFPHLFGLVRRIPNFFFFLVFLMNESQTFYALVRCSVNIINA